MVLTNETVANALRDGLRSVGAYHVILFGSRARGDAREDSDYDLLVITDRQLTAEVRYKVSGDIRKTCARQLVPVDVIVKSRDEFELQKQIAGTIVHNAVSEGVTVE